jgi:quinol monooxygenase YgiN
MVIVAGHFDVDPARRDEFIAGRVEAMSASRAEAGCVVYAFTADPVQPERVLLFERWETKDALLAHLEGMRSTPQPASEIEIRGAEIVQYEISRSGPLGS